MTVGPSAALLLLTWISGVTWFWSQAKIYEWALNHAREHAPHHVRFWLLGCFALHDLVSKYPALRRERGETAGLAWVHWTAMLSTFLFYGLSMLSIGQLSH